MPYLVFKNEQEKEDKRTKLVNFTRLIQQIDWFNGNLVLNNQINIKITQNSKS